ncbi:carboxypeptidase a, partial [Plakobranchus ocellatus]
TGVSNHCKDEKYPGHNPFSEPESFNIKYLVESLQNRLDAYVSVHSYSQIKTSKAMARRHCEDEGKYVEQRRERPRRMET